MVLGAFLILLAGWSAIYAYAALAPALSEAAGVPESVLSIIYALAGGACFLVGALAGPVADHVGPRGPVAAGIVIVALGLILASCASSLTAMTVTFGALTGIGVGLAYVPAMAAVQCCFTARRGLASGLAAMGIGVATVLVPTMHARFAPLGDWRVEMRVLAFVVLALGLAGVTMLQPHALNTHSKAEEPDLAAVRKTRAFRQLYLAVLLISVPVALPFAWLPRCAEIGGLARDEALALLGMIGVGSMLGRVALCFLGDRIGRGLTFLGCCIGLSLAMIVWACSTSVVLPAFAVAFGAFQGGFVALSPAVAVDLFGRRSAAGASGLLLTGRALALLVTVPAVAQATVLFGETLAIVATGICGLLGCALLRSVLATAPRRGAYGARLTLSPPVVAQPRKVNGDLADIRIRAP